MYTQAQMDEVINSARAHNAFMAKAMADVDESTAWLLASLREHVVAGRTERALKVIDDLIQLNAPK